MMKPKLEKTFSLEYREHKDDRAAKVKHERRQKDQRKKEAAAQKAFEESYCGDRVAARKDEAFLKKKMKHETGQKAKMRKNQGKEKLADACYQGQRWSGTSGRRKAGRLNRAGRIIQSSRERPRPYLENALALRLTAVETGHWPTARQECTRAAAHYLLCVSASQRPASIAALTRLVQLRRLCRLRCAVLVTPGSVAAAMLRVLEAGTSLYRAIEPFAAAGETVSARDQGPDPDHVAEAASRAVQNLRVIGTSRFLNWPAEECGNWLCSQCAVTLQMEPAALVEGLLADGFITQRDKGKLAYNDSMLQQVPLPLKAAAWRMSDIEVSLQAAARESICLSLGWGYIASWCATLLREAGLGELALRWRAETLAKLGDSAPGLSNVRLSLRSKWKSSVIGTQEVQTDIPGEWQTEEVFMHQKGREMSIQVVVFAADDDLISGFISTLQEVAEADVRDNFTPYSITMTGMDFWGRYWTLNALESMLGWDLEIVRNEKDGTYTGALIAVQHPDTSKASEDTLRRFLALYLNPKPAFTISCAVSAEVYAAVQAEDTSFIRQMEAINQVSLNFRQNAENSGEYDLVGWPRAEALQPELGLPGVFGRYKDVCVIAPARLDPPEDQASGFHECNLRSLRRHFRKQAADREKAAKAYLECVAEEEEQMQKKLASGQKVTVNYTFGA